MNTPIESNVQDTRPQVDEQRRRLTKGGLVAPVVLGTLLSRPVLGAAPYNCTISGQLSGNTSSHGTAELCSNLGDPPQTWKNLDPWPSTVVDKATLFTAVEFTDTYWRRVSNQQIVAPNTNNSAVATFQQVLMNQVGNDNPPKYIALGKAAIASYLNAQRYAPNYPITTADVVEMFNTAIADNNYDPLGVNWTPSQVLAYFRSLYQ